MKTYKGLRDLLAALVLSLLWTTPAQAPNLCTTQCNPCLAVASPLAAA
jgi:hypothetical protein